LKNGHFKNVQKWILQNRLNLKIVKVSLSRKINNIYYILMKIEI